MRGLATLVATVAALGLVAAAPATPPLPAQKAALTAVRQAVAAGQLDSATAAADRVEIGRAAHLIRALPAGRANHIAVALEEAAAFAGRLTKPRAVALFGQLKVNDDWFAAHWAPADKTDVTDADGVVYRYFVGRCFEFHPLANFGALNAHVAAGNSDATRRLADALVARGVYQHGGGIGWEYDFSFGGGRAPWLSGMAQAVAAQAFARAAGVVTDEAPALMREARAAYRVIPARLLTRVAAGPWIRLYAFQSTPVLNAQLQAVISLQSYAHDASDSVAATLAARMQRAAAATLSQFDTGYWTYYALPGELSPLDYQQYVVQLLTKLSAADPRFADAAKRFAAYQQQPPAFKLANGRLGELRLWLSKPATIHVDTAAGPARQLPLRDGWHTLAWQEPKRPGFYPLQVSAVDWAGNRAAFTALPIVRAVAAAAGASADRSTAGTAIGQPGFSVGAGLDDPGQAALARRLGLQLVRLAVVWPAGTASPDPGVVSALQRLPAGVRSVVELIANPLPADDAGLATLAQYAASLAQQVPALRALLLTPAPTVATVSGYAAALAAVRDAVHTAVPGSVVGPLVDGAVMPKTTVTALGQTLGEADIVAFRPAATAAPAAWTAAGVPALVAALTTAFGGTAPPVLIDGLATPTTIPPAELGAYPAGTVQASGAVSAKAQGSTYAAAITSAACSPNVAGVVLDRLADSATVPAPPAGLFYASGTAKGSGDAVAAAVAPAQRGILVCPGLAAPAAAASLSFPAELGPSSAAAVTLGCVRDCLYLLTLDTADGRPVVARRGALHGGAAAATVGLPATPLQPGTYRLDVRLVSQVNPGPVAQLMSPPLTVG